MSNSNQGGPIIERTLKGHKDGITSLAFHPVPSELGRRKQQYSTLVQIASSSQDGGLTLWNYQPYDSEVRAFRFVGHTDAINHLCYSPSGRLLASCSSDKTVRLWIPKRSGESMVLKGHHGAVRCVDFSQQDSSKDSLLVTCSDDKTLKLWNLPNKTFRRSLVGHKNWVRSCKFSPDSKFVLSGCDDGTIKLWDVKNGDNVVTYKFPSSVTTSLNAIYESSIGIRHVQFHPHGTLFAASGSNGNVHMYDLRSDKIVHSFPESNSASSLSLGLSFHPGCKHLMTCTEEGALCVWDLRSWKCNFSIKHTNSDADDNGKAKICSCDFSKNGMNFATGGTDKRVLVWKCDMDNEADKYDECRSKQHVEKEAKIPDRDYIIQSMPTKIKIDSNNAMSLDTRNKHSKERWTWTTHQNDITTSEPLAGTMNNIIGQLELITNTMAIIEKRLSLVEDAIKCKNKNK